MITAIAIAIRLPSLPSSRGEASKVASKVMSPLTVIPSVNPSQPEKEYEFSESLSLVGIPSGVVMTSPKCSLDSENTSPSTTKLIVYS